MQCEDVKDLPAWAFEPSVEVPAAERDHVNSCLRCQAEVARFRRLSRELGTLAHFTVDPGADVNQRIFAALDDPDALRVHNRQSRRTAYLSGLAAATAAGAAGALVIASRARNKRIAG